jgi:hypothetical protein
MTRSDEFRMSGNKSIKSNKVQKNGLKMAVERLFINVYEFHLFTTSYVVNLSLYSGLGFNRN